jgi:site-specific recombinase XerD
MRSGVRVPKLYHHTPTNQDAVIVRGPDGKRRTVYCGVHGSAEAQRRYREVLAQHLAGKPVVSARTANAKPSVWPTVGQLCAASGESMRRILDGWAHDAGIKVQVTPHGLRHSAATEVARLGSLDELMSLGGWRSFSAAQLYLDRRLEQRRRALKLVNA